ncbi:SDR family oxidoreductase [Sphingorhabdus sp.]|uniref:SDR family oxidoreductase n=1 Tax=Sphingorhabdus sp. TaxID=1902408 RepID=UPI003919853E
MTAKPLAIVTGGKRRLGAEIAAKLANAGYSLALVSHVDSSPEPPLAAALEKSQTEWHAFTFDLSTGNPDELIDAVSVHFGRTPDLLVNNAAMFGQDDWETMTLETLLAHFRLNLFSPLLLSKALVQAAGPKARPAIVNILDQRIVNPHRDQISYTLSKQALATSVRSMAASFAGRARYNGVAPGLVISTDDYTDDQESRLAGMMPLGKLPSPSAVADAIVYLATAQDVTGQVIFVDGGAHLKSFDRDFMHL